MSGCDLCVTYTTDVRHGYICVRVCVCVCMFKLQLYHRTQSRVLEGECQ